MPGRTRLGRHMRVELLHLSAGLAAALLVGALSAWAYPLGRREIWIVTAFATIATAALGFGQLRRAWIADRADEAGGGSAHG